MSATARSFTVFLDAPPADPVKPQQASDIPQSHSHDALSVSDLLSPAAAAKENLHPVTGESTTSSKKRKTSSVLATKAIHPPTSKKQKESKESKESQSTAVLKPKSETTKKRKASISASASSPLKAKAKGAVASEKEPKRTVLGGVPATKKKSSSGSSRVSKRKVTTLPKLEEVHEVAEAAEGEAAEGAMTQANVDSRCYELTVLPLADVTQAYDASPTMDYIPLGEEPSTKANAALSRALRVSTSSRLPSSLAHPCSRQNPRSPICATATRPH